MLSKDTPGTRHAGGWLVLGTILLVGSLINSGASWSRRMNVTGASNSSTVRTAAEVAVGFPRFQVDVNRADVAELSAVPGIGPKLAKRIVDHRTIHGPFRTLRDLEQVPGVGPRMASTLGQAIGPEAMIDPDNAAQQHVAMNLMEQSEETGPESEVIDHESNE